MSKISRCDLLTKCEELGLSKYKTKNMNQLVELIESKTKENSEVSEDTETTNSYNSKVVLINNDCMLELNKMKDNSIDCVITDTPYFI